MAKHKPIVELVSYGIYTKWDADNKSLPKIREFTTQIPAQLDIEFGFVVNIKRAKNARMRYCIYHPGIPDESGQPMAPFDGLEYVRSNDWDFYLGDTLWEPLNNKLGNWRMTLELDGNVVADKTFCVEAELPYEGAQFWARRKFRAPF
ncbi:DUF3859 domain-containing protein [Alteromonas aestuariivivens]|uniref:DUF3859 domain-containing protein n=1 Tax=Alteromonas aestuariivivens TaxID=1938339 RepID=A0A3D8M9Z9_9ALTE|nr:DUF3859 domain-containing protein [Alteromonas aestuariivivens]RDV26806.1 DUF3859 domain-containing protein [Alteromonas aestuariivivens]